MKLSSRLYLDGIQALCVTPFRINENKLLSSTFKHLVAGMTIDELVIYQTETTSASAVVFWMNLLTNWLHYTSRSISGPGHHDS